MPHPSHSPCFDHLSTIGKTYKTLDIQYYPFMWPCIVTNLFLIKPTDALISQIYFCQETLHVSGSSSAHHQEFSTVHCCTFGTGICHAGLMTYTSAECTVENSWWWQRKYPKHVEFLDKNKCGKLVCLLVLLKRNNIIHSPVISSGLFPYIILRTNFRPSSAHILTGHGTR